MIIILRIVPMKKNSCHQNDFCNIYIFLNIYLDPIHHFYIHTIFFQLLGLDPAKPFFDLVSIDYRIQPTDAELVDVIHTNSGELWDAAVSFPDPLGQVDFYPNGGSHQKGCTDLCQGLHMGFACIGFDLIDFFLGM